MSGPRKLTPEQQAACDQAAAVAAARNDGGWPCLHGVAWPGMDAVWPDDACMEEAVPGTLRCLEHLPGVLEHPQAQVVHWAEEYALASLLYYEHPDHARMLISDARYDGTAHALLKARAWRVVSWLTEDDLRAGTGYALAVPDYIRGLVE